MKSIYLFLFLALELLACGKKEAPPPTDVAGADTDTTVVLSDAQIQSAGIVTALPQQKDLASLLKVNGAVDVPPQSMVSVSVPLGGYLKSTHLLPGMHVRKGEVIATLEDQQYIQLQEDYLVTQSKLRYAETEYNRQKELRQSQSSSDKVYQQSNMEYEQNRIVLRALGEKLKLIQIDPLQLNESNISRSISVLSPITGFVSSVKVNIGKYVTPADVLFELVDPEDIHLNLRVFEKDVAKLSIGQPLTAYTIHAPDARYPCEIMLISQSLSEDRTVEVHCHFKKYDRILLPGMYMNAEIELHNHDALVVPEEAVVMFEGRGYAFIAEAPREFRMVPVITGMNEGGYIEIMDASTWKDKQVVVKGAYTLLMELKNKSEE